jgi:hypothetical protein
VTFMPNKSMVPTAPNPPALAAAAHRQAVGRPGQRDRRPTREQSADHKQRTTDLGQRGRAMTTSHTVSDERRELPRPTCETGSDSLPASDAPNAILVGELTCTA